MVLLYRIEMFNAFQIKFTLQSQTAYKQQIQTILPNNKMTHEKWTLI